MRYLCLIIIIITMASCENKKSAIVEELKKAKNQLMEAEMNRSSYSSAASRLRAYNDMMQSSKKHNSKQMEMDALAYKKGYESELNNLKGVPNEILKDENKLDSTAFVWEQKSNDAKRKIDSLETELKKY